MVAGLILAAGQSSRFGAANKLLEQWQEKPLVRHVYDAAIISQLSRCIIISGHEAKAVQQALPKEAKLCYNSDYASGMASSIRCGMKGLFPSLLDGDKAIEAEAVLILLADMPLITHQHINTMIEAYKGRGAKNTIVSATCLGQLGNPVLLGPDHFSYLMQLQGDKGARQLFDASKSDENAAHSSLLKIEIGEAAKRDFDTAQDFTKGLFP